MDKHETKNKIIESKTTLKNSTVEAYIQAIFKLVKKVFLADRLSITFFICTEPIKKYIDSYTNISTKKNILTAILVILKVFEFKKSYPVAYKEYEDIHHELSQAQREHYSLNTKTIKETDNWITSVDIKDKVTDITRKIRNEMNSSAWNRNLLDLYQQYLVIVLYTDLPPLRNEYANTVVYDILNTPIEQLDNSKNYINIESKKLILCNYKTSNSYGIKEIILTDNIVEVIKSWFYIRYKVVPKDEQSADLLINIVKYDCMTKNGLTKYLNKIFKPKKVSTTMLRKSFLSEKYPVVHTFQEMQNDSYIMGHSISTQQQIYRKQ